MAALYVSLILKVRVAILQNGGIRLCFHAIVRLGRMPPTDTETIGGISTGLSSYSGRVCVPPYLQMLIVCSYLIVRRQPARHNLYSYLNYIPSLNVSHRDIFGERHIRRSNSTPQVQVPAFRNRSRQSHGSARLRTGLRRKSPARPNTGRMNANPTPRRNRPEALHRQQV